MMIRKVSSCAPQGYLYTPLCDRCGTELPAVESFVDALDAMDDAGWLVLPPEKGNGLYWEHYCPKCRRRWEDDAVGEGY